jgi:hypothetical protein
MFDLYKKFLIDRVFQYSHLIKAKKRLKKYFLQNFNGDISGGRVNLKKYLRKRDVEIFCRTNKIIELIVDIK